MALADDAVVVTGLGAASSLGTGVAAHRDALRAGRDGFRPVTRFDTRAMTTRLAATWPGWDGRVQPEPGPGLDLADTARDFPLHELALVAAREAWGTRGEDRRTAVVFGTCFGHGFREFHEVTDRIAAGLGSKGPRVTISTACASSTHAIGLGRDMLLRGETDAVVAGGADTLLREAFAGFSALGVLSGQPCAPFSEPAGTILGEGAGFVVLERASDALRRGAATWATIQGYGLSADGFHETTPDPSGAGIERAIRGALLDAGWADGAVDFVSAHATGTANNDRVEWSVIERVLGAGRPPPVVSGSKSQIGHAQGAAGVLELVLHLICQREGRVPPTLHFRGPRAGCPGDPVAATEPRVHAVSRALKLSAAFGGANAVLAYRCGAGATSPPRPRRSPVVVSSTAVVGPIGAFRRPGVADLTRQRGVGPCPEPDLHRIGIDPRRLDPSARWLTAAATLALGAGERRRAMEKRGLFVGASRMPAESSRRCRDSIRKRGIAGTSASAFARMSVNAPAGACSRVLGLLGPTTTVSIGEGSGLLAVVLAADWLSSREDADEIAAGGVDERTDRDPDETEGAACLVLDRGGGKGEAIVAAGWAIAGRGETAEAARRAMGERSSVDCVLAEGAPGAIAPLNDLVVCGSRLGVVDASRLWARSDATRSCVMAALAVAYLDEGHARS
ncbi:MAG: beta-ketoacyl synthase N-terminal-like domain-containing protein, partial [Polyangiaceae bacterium]